MPMLTATIRYLKEKLIQNIAQIWSRDQKKSFGAISYDDRDKVFAPTHKQQSFGYIGYKLTLQSKRVKYFVGVERLANIRSVM